MTNKQRGDTMELKYGDHATREDGLCLMEAVALLGGEGHTDKPECACPVLSAFGRKLNDGMGKGAEGDALRAKYLADLAPRLVGTQATPEVELKRAFIFTDGAVRVLAPIALDATGLCDAAATLRALSPVTSQATAQAAEAAEAAANAAEAAAAWAAEAAAEAAAAAAAAAGGVDAVWAAEAAAEAAAAAANAAANADVWVEARALFIRAIEVSDE
jgi:hypothetical protein